MCAWGLVLPSLEQTVVQEAATCPRQAHKVFVCVHRTRAARVYVVFGSVGGRGRRRKAKHGEKRGHRGGATGAGWEAAGRGGVGFGQWSGGRGGG